MRTFVAVEISNAIRSAAARVLRKLTDLGGDFKWVAPVNLHLTLNFLGELPDAAVVDVCRLTSEAAAGFEPFEVSFGGLGCFPGLANPRIVWLGVDRGSQQLTEIQKKLSQAYQPLSLPADRRTYRPHLTLGRARRRIQLPFEFERFLSQSANLEVGSMLVNEIVVFSSHLDRSGPNYTPMATVRLGP